jgi:hypothetical protein
MREWITERNGSIPRRCMDQPKDDAWINTKRMLDQPREEESTDLKKVPGFKAKRRVRLNKMNKLVQRRIFGC